MNLRTAAAALMLSVLSLSSCRPKPDFPSPAFRLTGAELEGAISGLPAGTAAKILAQPAVFLDLMNTTLAAPQDLLTIVDKANSLPRDAVPPDLVSLDGRSLTVTRAGLTLRSVVLPDLTAMVADARAAGLTLPLSSTYRGFEYQEQLFTRSLATQSSEVVERELARPGHSEHQLGTTMDFGSVDASFADTAAGRWLAANAWRFGFVLSYPQGSDQETGYIHEPWHYRYLGRSGAALVHDFFEGRPHVFLVFYRSARGFFEERLAGPARR